MEQKEKIVWSVTQVNQAVREMIEGSLMPFYLQGEVSSLVSAASGHAYFNLKDERCQMRATFFGGVSECRQLNIQNGDLVEVYGKLTVYPPRGEYQFNVKSLRRAGLGDLQRQFEKIKNKLAAEGLFAAERKKPLPQLPHCVGVITSPTGAALRDFLQIVNRRFPDLPVKIYGAQVQGGEAALQVARGIEFFNRTEACDVIVVTRGGGSMEDLWCFNDENLARVIAWSKIPIISAVGHEIDFTIADFVSDLRAPTPSAAAELVVGKFTDLSDRIAQYDKAFLQSVRLRAEAAGRQLETLERRLANCEPHRQLENYMQKIDETMVTMAHLAAQRLTAAAGRLDACNGRLYGVDPKRVLERGFVLLRDRESGQVITSSKQPADRRLIAQMRDGELALITGQGQDK